MGKKIGHYDYVPAAGLVLDQKDNVERDGYRDTETMINEMIFAGERLMEQRKEDYDFENDDVSNLDEPVKAGLDIIDVQRDIDRVNGNLEVVRKDLAKAKKSGLVTPNDVDIVKEDKDGSA